MFLVDCASEMIQNEIAADFKKNLRAVACGEATS